MTGPEHYREAERLMAPRKGYYNGDQTVTDEPPTPHNVAQAQVHATLALVAATAASLIDITDEKAWSEATR